MNLYGASGHAKVIIDILNKSGQIISKIFDDNRTLSNVLGIKISNTSEIQNDDVFIISIGNNKTRKLVSEKLNTQFIKAIHPSSVIDTSTEIEVGTVVMAGVVINSSTKIGKHCIINTSSSIDHDCILEDYVHISPNATLCGNVSIGEGTHVGASVTIIPGIKIGKWVTIGAGTVVISDIPDNATVVGNPGRII